MVQRQAGGQIAQGPLFGVALCVSDIRTTQRAKENNPAAEKFVRSPRQVKQGIDDLPGRTRSACARAVGRLPVLQLAEESTDLDVAGTGILREVMGTRRNPLRFMK
jgi:hypothetical protein